MLRIFFIIISVLNVNHCLEISDAEYQLMPKLFHLDDFDQCMLLEENALYCTFTFELGPRFLENESKIWNIIKNASSDPRNYRHDRLRHGICLPTFCNSSALNINATKENLQICYNKKYESLGLKGNISLLKCQRKESNYVLDIYDIIFGALFISYFLVVIMASLYEGRARYQKKDVYERIVNSTGGRIIASFSIPRNWNRLTLYNSNPDAEKLRSIQGIRFYNLICVILSHTIMITFAGPVSNPQYTEKMTGKLLNMFLANGSYAVQTFFVISGWLLSFHFFEIMENRKTLNLKYLLAAFINRYIRLTPTLAAMIAFETTWLRHLGRGPCWDDHVGEEYENCRKNWWKNLLYINNYVDKNNMCLHQTWYIASDTQLYAMSLIILTLIWKFEHKVKLILGTTMVIGLFIQGSVAFFKNYEIIIRQYPEVLYKLRGLRVAAWHDLYSSGYSNICGYSIGLTFGYIFYKTRNKVFPITKIHQILWWILTFGMCDFVILIAIKMYSPDYKSSPLESALYWAFGKNVFAFGIAIGIYGFSQKIGWFARWICEWKSVSIIGRLTYSTYIVHSAIVRIRGGLLRSPVYVNDYLLLMTTLSDIALSYLFGTLMCLMFEMPISALQKLMMPQMKTKRIKDPSEKSLKGMDVNECGNEHNQQLTFSKI